MVAIPAQPSQPLPLTFFVAGRPISTNQRTRRTRTGHFYVTREARVWENSVASAAMCFRQCCRALGKPLHLRFTFIGGRADVDNYLKCLMDGLKSGLMVDDYWFNPIEVSREPLRKRTRGVLIECWRAA